MMQFDYKTFSELLTVFISEGEKIKRFDSGEISRIVAPMCRFLRIARFSARFDDKNDSTNFPPEPLIYFDSGRSDESGKLTFTEELIRGGTVSYTISPYCGEPGWTEDELTHISLFEKQIFVFTGRGHVIRILNELSLEDNEFGIKTPTYLMTALDRLIDRKEISEYIAAFFNLRRFSLINEKIGRKTANKVMVAYVQGLHNKLNKDGFVCRMDGDNFFVIFRQEHLHYVKKYLSGRNIIYNDGQDTIKISSTAGYYIIPEDIESVSEIIDRASAACQLARIVYNRPYVFYDRNIMQHQERIREIETLFPKAIAKEAFQVFYQPKTQLNTYQIAGAEALCRWIRDDRIIPPSDFIPILESSKAICTLDFYMLAHVCRDIRRWLNEGREVVKISVNLSRLHLGDENLLDTIIGIIDKYNVPHKYIEIELTETTTDVDYAELKKLVCGLREQGISTSVDDFGMGYSSLNLIREMPWNVLKIDKSFLPTQDEYQDRSKLNMLRHIITMSEDLGLECIVEGVETAEQVKLLKDCKCYMAQGYFFDRPLPVKDFESRLDANAC